MREKDISEYKRRYHTFRHHAWAGLGFLAVLMAVRIIIPELEILTPIIVILLLYIVVALLFTYRYSSGLKSEGKVVQVEPSAELEKEKLKSEVEKERLKVEKKEAKAEAKKTKKQKK